MWPPSVIRTLPLPHHRSPPRRSVLRWSLYGSLLALLLLSLVAAGVILSMWGPFDLAEGMERRKSFSSLAAVDKDSDAFLVRLNSLPSGMPGSDKRGWIANPLHAALQAGLIGESQAGPKSCVDVHVGVIEPGSTRANHRHSRKNETFLLWGARARWRIENADLPRGYAEVILERGDVASIWAGIGRAHAVTNIDTNAVLNLNVCADAEWDPKNPATDYHVWDDL